MLTQKEQKLPLPTIEKFSFKKNDWEFWIKGYTRYRSEIKLNHLPQVQQINQLLFQMGTEVDKVLYNSNKKQEDFTTYDELKKFFDKLYEKKANIIYERAKFNQRNQREGETVEEYITDLLKLVKNCKYGDLTEELVRDRLVVGITDRELSERLQMDKGLTMQKAIEKVQQAEAVKEQNKPMRQEATINIERIQQKRGKENGSKMWKRYPKNGENRRRYAECIRCGARPSHPFFKCPAGKVRCHKCQERGHFSKYCRTMQRQIREVRESDLEAESSYGKQN